MSKWVYSGNSKGNRFAPLESWELTVKGGKITVDRYTDELEITTPARSYNFLHLRRGNKHLVHHPSTSQGNYELYYRELSELPAHARQMMISSWTHEDRFLARHEATQRRIKQLWLLEKQQLTAKNEHFNR